MAHKVETMAYNLEETPWHGLGVPVIGDLTPLQMLDKAGLDWTVEKEPAYCVINEKVVPIGRSALVRNTDHKVLDIVTNDWNPVQNLQAFEFFNDFVEAGEMSMETAGSLCGGQLVWALAKINESFDVLRKKDKVDAYLLFTNPHRYGWATSVSFTAIRVVCWNTLTTSLNETGKDKILKVNHRVVFDNEEVKEVLEISKNKLGEYKARAQFLAKTKAKNEDVVAYFKRLFPVITTKGEYCSKNISKSATACHAILESQPGADIAPGTWWNTYNAVTFHQDHLAGRDDADAADRRLTSAWYGDARQLKRKALNLAVEMANAS